MRPGFRPDLELPLPTERPLVGNVEAMAGMRSGVGQDSSRDETILGLLRERLEERRQGNIPATGGRRASDKRPAGAEDKYEPQRINRKICWQYDQTAHKIPLLRRHYI